MNIIIIILAGLAAYVLAELFTIIDGTIAEWQLKKEEKKRLNNELYRFKLRQLYYYCEAYYISCGFSRKQAEIMAINAVHEMDQNFIVDDKFRMIRGKNENGNGRNQRRSV